jgi:hypothetical protein
MTFEELLVANGIALDKIRWSSASRGYTTCPRCSHKRSKAHQHAQCLGITRDGDRGRWGCSHCSWTGPEKGAASGNGQRPIPQRDNFVATYDYGGFQKVRYPKGHKPPFAIRHRAGNSWKWGAGDADTNVLYRKEEIEEAIALGHPIAVPEGEKDCNNLRAIGIYACCNAHGASEPGKAPKWKLVHSEQLRGADIVVMPDHDAAGYAHADAVCRLSLGIAKRVRRLELAKHWPECPAGGDISEWLADGHTREQLDELIRQAPEYQGKTPVARFKLVRFGQITLQTTPAYLVAGLIPRVGLVVIWGPMKCGKSFWTFDLVMHVALGWPYRGRKVRQGEIVYLLLEGHAGFNRRVEVFRRKYSIADAPFYLITASIDLVHDHLMLITDIRAHSAKPAAVVIDTLNRSLFGSESKDQDMSAYVRAADVVREAFDCAVVIIHHCGVDDTRPRGHTSLGGNLDAQLAVKRDTARNVVVEVEWMKDGDSEGDTIISKLERIELGPDEDGNEMSSCVVVPVEDTASAVPKAKGKTRLPKAARTALRALTEALDEVGSVPPASNHIPSNVKTVTFDQWRQYAYARGISTGEERAKQQAFSRATECLIGDEHVDSWQEQAWTK